MNETKKRVTVTPKGHSLHVAVIWCDEVVSCETGPLVKMFSKGEVIGFAYTDNAAVSVEEVKV